jgi:hypothetical protein
MAKSDPPISLRSVSFFVGLWQVVVRAVITKTGSGGQTLHLSQNTYAARKKTHIVVLGK